MTAVISTRATPEISVAPTNSASMALRKLRAIKSSTLLDCGRPEPSRARADPNGGLSAGPAGSASSSVHCLDLLDGGGVFCAVLVPDRLYRLLERRLFGDLDDVDVGSLHLL